jgi:hypothetical protein
MIHIFPQITSYTCIKTTFQNERNVFFFLLFILTYVEVETLVITYESKETKGHKHVSLMIALIGNFEL